MELQVWQVCVVDQLPDAVDCDGYSAARLERRPHSNSAPPRCTAVLFCADERGDSVAVTVRDWRPSLLVANADSYDGTAAELALRLGGSVAGRLRAARLFDFQLDADGRQRREETWLRVRFPTVKALRAARRKCDSIRESGAGAPSLHEHRIAVETKFLDELQISPCGWIRLKRFSDSRAAGFRRTHCCAELECDVAALQPIARQDIAPITIASVDIECRQGQDGSFPVPERNPIICVGTVFARPGSAGLAGARRVVHCLRGCSAIPGTAVHDGFDGELDMLDAWRDTLVANDVFVVIGYNLLGFDYPYIVARHNSRAGTCEWGGRGGDQHGIGWDLDCGTRLPFLSRFVCAPSVAREKTLSSSAMGQNDLHEILADGRCTLDLLLYVKTTYQRSRYTLDAISKEFLGAQKNEITHAEIYSFYDGTNEQRARYCAYCVQDCMLPLRLCVEMSVLESYVQTARVQFTQLAQLVSRGQQIRVFNMLQREAHASGFVVDREPSYGSAAAPSRGVTYEGATVLEPMPGLYRTPVATLDFASLYPSIMRAHNLCYSTLWTGARPPPPWLRTETLAGCTFVTDGAFRGVLPRMLDKLLAERSATKRRMAAETDPSRRALLDKLQLAQKVSANSVYGFTGAVDRGMYPCREVAMITTARGRMYIDQTKALVESAYGNTVIYGDTDSVMVHMGPIDVPQSFERAQEMAGYISAQFPDAIVLEFEKVYMPYLLRGKKRYVGCKYEGDPAAAPSMDCKGIEMVRRDNAPLARQIQRDSLQSVVMRSDAAAAVESIRALLCRVMRHEVPHEDYIITKSVGANYKSDRLPHVQVARKLAARGQPVPAGGRVEYVVLRGRGQLFERTEDASHALRNHLCVDREYYIAKQLAAPLLKLFEGVLRLGPMFDAALDEVRAQEGRADREVALRTLGVSFSTGAANTRTLEREARDALLGQKEENATQRSKKRPLDAYLVPV